MNKRRVIEHAKEYLEQLSKGVDPINQVEYGPDSPAAEPRLQKCFAFVAGILDELLSSGGFVSLQDEAPKPAANGVAPQLQPQYEVVRKKVPFQLSPEQRRFVYIDQRPITPYSFVNHINKVIDTSAMEKLTMKRVNNWLLKGGYIAPTRQPVVVNRTVVKPMQKAAEIGIAEEETTNPTTGEIKSRIVLTPRAQAFLLDNLDRILEEA